jgi:hypothetical protein
VQRGGATSLPRLPWFVLLAALAIGAPPASATFEICGNCLDDDGDGLVDLADPSCCAPERTGVMERIGGRIAPGEAGSRLRLAATLGAGARLSPDGQQVLMQLGTEPNGSFCASMPPNAFRGTAERLRVAGAPIAGARGVRHMLLARAADGTIRWRARGRRVGFSTDERAGLLDILVLLADAADPGAGPRCFTARAFFRPGPRGTLVAD